MESHVAIVDAHMLNRGNVVCIPPPSFSDGSKLGHDRVPRSTIRGRKACRSRDEPPQLRYVIRRYVNCKVQTGSFHMILRHAILTRTAQLHRLPARAVSLSSARFAWAASFTLANG